VTARFPDATVGGVDVGGAAVGGIGLGRGLDVDDDDCAGVGVGADTRAALVECVVVAGADFLDGVGRTFDG